MTFGRGAGDEAEFARFVAAAAPRLRRVAYAVSGSWEQADDSVQDALVKAYAHWRRVRAADSPTAYVTTIVVRLALSESQRSVRRRAAEAGAGPGARQHDPTGGVDDRLDLARLLGGLTRNQRAVLVLRFLEDRPVADVARVLGVSEGTVTRQSHDAFRRLRHDLAIVHEER